jgi:integrase
VTIEAGPRFRAFWATDRVTEKQAFERFIDFTIARLERWPDAVESWRARSPPGAALARRLPDGAGRPFLRRHARPSARSDRFRDRVLARSARLANERRSEQGLPALPKITPHSLRRTWAMLVAQAGRDPHWIADQIGHTSAAFMLQVYQQTATAA